MYRNEHKTNKDEILLINSEEDYQGMPNEGLEIAPSDLEMDMNNTDEINQRTLENIEIDTETGRNWLSSGGNELQEILQIQNKNNLKTNINYNFTPNFNNSEENPNSKSKSSQSHDTNYIDLLELKIRKQARRLCELQEYKSICEKRILQLNPGHELPITENHLNSHNNNTNSFSSEFQMNNLIHSYKFQIQDLTNKLLKKENDHKGLLRKHEELVKKHSHYLSESVPKSLLHNQTHFFSTNENLFPNAERIPNEKMRDAYSKLLSTFREIMREKQQILDTLKMETINSEEQRNYIEILKQTIENNLQKNGLLQLIEKQKNLYYKNSTSNSSVDVLIDIVQLRNEIEKYRKESIMNDVTNSELRSEIEFLREANSQMNSKKEKIREGLEKGIRELEEAKEKVKSLENEREFLSEEFNEMKDCYENILRENENLNEKVNALFKENDDLNQKLENQKILEDKLVEYKNNFVFINNQLDGLLIEKKNLENEKEVLFTENKKLNEDLIRLKSNLKEFEEKSNTLKKQNEKIEIKNNELNESLNNSIKLLTETEKNLESFKSEYENILQQLKEKNFEMEEKSKEFQEMKKENEIITEENFRLKKLNSDKILENENLRKEATEISKNFNKIFTQYEATNKSYKNLESLNSILKIEKENLAKEISNFKEKFYSDTNSSKKKIPQVHLQVNPSNSSKDLEKQNCSNTSNLKSEIKKLKEEIEVCKLNHNETENLLKQEIQNLKNRIETQIKEKNFLEIRLNEREKSIHIIQEELEKKNKIKNNSEHFENLEKIHNLTATSEKLLNELRSFKNDNKKLYDFNKKLQDENSKIFFFKKEIQNLQNFTTRILNSIPNQELSQMYKEYLEHTENILSIESDKSKISKKIQILEKEIFRIKTESNKNIETEIKLANEIKNLNNKLVELEKKVNEMRQGIFKLEKEMKILEERNFIQFSGFNVFKANYVEKQIDKDKEKENSLNENEYENFSFEKFEKISESKEKSKKRMEITINKEVVLNNISNYNSNRSLNKSNTSRNSPSTSKDRKNNQSNSARGRDKIKSLIKGGLNLNQPSTLYYKRALDIKKK